MYFLAQAATYDLSPAGIIAIAATIVAAMATALGIVYRNNATNQDRNFTAQQTREKSFAQMLADKETSCAKERAVHQEGMERREREHRAEMAEERARYERLTEARAQDAEAWRTAAARVFEESARAVEAAERAVALVAGPSTPPPDAPHMLTPPSPAPRDRESRTSALPPIGPSRTSMNPDESNPPRTRRPSRSTQGGGTHG